MPFTTIFNTLKPFRLPIRAFCFSYTFFLTWWIRNLSEESDSEYYRLYALPGVSATYSWFLLHYLFVFTTLCSGCFEIHLCCCLSQQFVHFWYWVAFHSIDIPQDLGFFFCFFFLYFLGDFHDLVFQYLTFFLKNFSLGTSLAAQWLRLPASTAEGIG